jgi:hypothetical protein
MSDKEDISVLIMGVRPGACLRERRSQQKSEAIEFRATSEKSLQGDTQHRLRRGKSLQLLCSPAVGTRVTSFVRRVGAVQGAWSYGTHAHDHQAEGATLFTQHFDGCKKKASKKEEI